MLESTFTWNCDGVLVMFLNGANLQMNKSEIQILNSLVIIFNNNKNSTHKINNHNVDTSTHNVVKKKRGIRKVFHSEKVQSSLQTLPVLSTNVNM